MKEGIGMRIVWGYVLTYGWVFFLLGISTLLQKAFHASGEVTRKVVHIGCGFAWFIMTVCFGCTWHLLIPPVTFIAMNYLSYKKGLFSAMERGGKSSPGTVYYPIGMTLMAAYYVFADERFLLPYGIALMCLSLGDGFAPIFGGIQKGNRKLVGGKTLYGSLAVFGFSLLTALCMLFGSNYRSLGLWLLPVSLLAALVAAVTELFSKRGLDNLFLPVGTGFTVYLLLLLLE